MHLPMAVERACRHCALARRGSGIHGGLVLPPPLLAIPPDEAGGETKHHRISAGVVRERIPRADKPAASGAYAKLLHDDLPPAGVRNCLPHGFLPIKAGPNFGIGSGRYLGAIDKSPLTRT